MTQIQKTVAICVVAGIALTSPSVVALSQPEDERAVGSKVTLNACVERGQKADTFVLTHVEAIPVHPASHGRVVYSFNAVKPLRPHVGHQVRLTGTITDVDKNEMEVKLGEDGKGGWTVEIEAPGKDVKATPAQLGISTAGRPKNDIRITVVKVKLEDLAMLAATCPTR